MLSNESIQTKSLQIGFSEQGKPIEVFFLGKSNAPLRVFIIAGQHGDEKYAKKAVEKFIAPKQSKNIELFPSIYFAILPNANPDGAILKSRKNFRGVDLNRDHQILESKETQSIHSFVNEWKPHVVIDVHNYHSRRKHLLAKNLVYQHDVFMDVCNNPSIHPFSFNPQNLLESVRTYLKSKNISCERYTIVTKSGRVRHSTPNVMDARNSLALRYNILTILLEGKNPRRKEGKEGRMRIIQAQYDALIGTMKWLEENMQIFVTNNVDTRSRIPIWARYSKKQSHSLRLKNAESNKDEIVEFNKYTPTLDITRTISLPSFYAIPKSNKKVLQILQRHSIYPEKASQSHNYDVESYFIVSAKKSVRKNRPYRNLKVITKNVKSELKEYFLFKVNKENGSFLAVFLEPESKYGLQRYPHLDLNVSQEKDFPC